MHDIGIGDRQDHPRHGGAQPFIQQVLQIDRIGLTIGPELVIHAVISG